MNKSELDTEDGRAPSGQALVSDQAPTGLDPAGFDPSRGFDWYRLLPQYWFQNEPTDRLWDAILNRLLDEFEPRKDYATHHFGPVEVWTENWPYQYGYQWGPAKTRSLPMVRTRRRLRAIVGRKPPKPVESFEVTTAVVAAALRARAAQ